MLDLDRYTDPVVMREMLQRDLPQLAHGARIEQLQVRHVLRRAPRRDAASEVCRIAVCYELDLGTRWQIIYGKVYPATVGPRETARLRAAHDRSTATWIDELDMIVWTFPDDPQLPQLGALMQPARAVAGLPGAPHSGSTWPTPEVIRYRPEERALLRYSLARGAIYAKTFCDDAGAALPRRFAHFAQADAFVVAEPLGYDAATRTFWQRGIDTQPLTQVIDTAHCAAWMDAAAQALASLHAADALPAPARSIADLIESSRRRVVKIEKVFPEFGVDARATLAQIIEHAPRSAPQTLLHGDFHLEQLHVCGARLALFDFDEFARGDPLEDVASFVVKCTLADSRLAREVGDALVASYASHAPQWFEAGRLDWHLAVQWLHKASRAFVWQRPGWRAQAEQMLAAARTAAQRAARITSRSTSLSSSPIAPIAPPPSNRATAPGSDPANDSTRGGNEVAQHAGVGVCA